MSNISNLCPDLLDPAMSENKAIENFRDEVVFFRNRPKLFAQKFRADSASHDYSIECCKRHSKFKRSKKIPFRLWAIMAGFLICLSVSVTGKIFLE